MVLLFVNDSVLFASESGCEVLGSFSNCITVCDCWPCDVLVHELYCVAHTVGFFCADVAVES